MGPGHHSVSCNIQLISGTWSGVKEMTRNLKWWKLFGIVRFRFGQKPTPVPCTRLTQRKVWLHTGSLLSFQGVFGQKKSERCKNSRCSSVFSSGFANFLIQQPCNQRGKGNHTFFLTIKTRKITNLFCIRLNFQVIF